MQRPSRSTYHQGFTIVELLIVVIIIAILAAITIVAYNSMQTRAKNSAAQATLNTFAKKIHAYNVINGSYPSATGTVMTTLNSITESKMGSANILIGTPDASTGTNTVKVEICGTGAGIKLTGWDYTANTISSTPLALGNVGGTCNAATA